MLYPMQWQVYHKRASHVHNGLDSAFWLWILTLRPNYGETLGLALSFAIIAVFICQKHTFITMTMGDLRTCLLQQTLLKSQFPQHSFICSKWDLIINPNQIRHGIIIDATAVKSILATFVTISILKSSMYAHNEFIYEENAPNSYLSQASIPSFSGKALTFDTPGDRFLDLPNKKDSQTGTAHFAAVLSLGTIIGYIKCLVPSGSSTCWGLIIYWIRCMLIHHLQCHRKIYLWA